jgi:N6-adenosine-specific RNA methylase IME4
MSENKKKLTLSPLHLFALIEIKNKGNIVYLKYKNTHITRKQKTWNSWPLNWCPSLKWSITNLEWY